MKDLTHTGDSSNIAFYSEPTSCHGDVWAEVLRSDPEFRRRRHNPGKGAWFYVTVYRIGQGEIATKTYRPRGAVPPGPLDGKTVSRLVRAALKGT